MLNENDLGCQNQPSFCEEKHMSLLQGWTDYPKTIKKHHDWFIDSWQTIVV